MVKIFVLGCVLAALAITLKVRVDTRSDRAKLIKARTVHVEERCTLKISKIHKIVV